jgi:septum formation inhibitor-activating ATPase MinD
VIMMPSSPRTNFSSAKIHFGCERRVIFDFVNVIQNGITFHLV